MGLDPDRVECTEWLGAVMEKLREGDGKAEVVIKPVNGKQLRLGVAPPVTHHLLPVLRICITLMRSGSSYSLYAYPDPAPSLRESTSL